MYACMCRNVILLVGNIFFSEIVYLKCFFFSVNKKVWTVAWIINFLDNISYTYLLGNYSLTRLDRQEFPARINLPYLNLNRVILCLFSSRTPIKPTRLKIGSKINSESDAFGLHYKFPIIYYRNVALLKFIAF